MTAALARALRLLALALVTAAALPVTPALAQDEVPFITTPDRVTLAMLGLAQVGPGDHLIDLGSGDGRIVITAARRFGATGLGVEIVPDLVQRSRDAAVFAGVQRRVRFVEQDLFQTDLTGATVVTMYLLPDVNLLLRPRLLALAPGTRIVSHDWDMGDWPPDQSITLDVPEKTIGRELSSRVHLWVVPARVHGLWCGAGARLVVDQRFQAFSASLNADVPAADPTPGTAAAGARAAPLLVVDGRISGRSLSSQGLTPVQIDAEPGALRLGSLPGAASPWSGQRFVPAQGQRCPG